MQVSELTGVESPLFVVVEVQVRLYTNPIYFVREQHLLNTIHRIKTHNDTITWTRLCGKALVCGREVLGSILCNKKYFANFVNSKILHSLHIINTILQQVHQHNVILCEFREQKNTIHLINTILQQNVWSHAVLSSIPSSNIFIQFVPQFVSWKSLMIMSTNLTQW
jgi:hypothetical protein